MKKDHIIQTLKFISLVAILAALLSSCATSYPIPPANNQNNHKPVIYYF